MLRGNDLVFLRYGHGEQLFSLCSLSWYGDSKEHTGKRTEYVLFKRKFLQGVHCRVLTVVWHNIALHNVDSCNAQYL